MSIDKKSNNNNNNSSKPKISILEIFLRFMFGFLVPFVLINGLIFFLFIQTPTINIVEENNENYEENKLKFSVDCKLPITEINVYYQNDTIIPYTKLGDYYSVDIENNGLYTIKAVALNKAQSSYPLNVETRDSVPPTIDIDSAVITGNTLIINVHDDQSGINYETIYASIDDTENISPTFIDRASGTIQFVIENGNKINIFVEDMEGNHSGTSITIS